MTAASKPHFATGPAPHPRAWVITFFAALITRVLFCFVAIPMLGLNLGPARSDFHSSTDGYTTLGANLIDHGVYSFAPDERPTSYRAPGYPAALAVGYAITGDINVTVLVVNCLSSAATCVFVLLIAGQLFGDRVNGWWALPAIFFPLSIYYCANAFSDTFFAFTVVAFIWATIRLIQEPTVRNGVIAALCFALGALTKAVVLPIPFLLLAFVALVRRPAIKSALIALVLGLSLTSMWTYRNYMATHEFTPVTGGTGFNMLLGNFMLEEGRDCDSSLKHARRRALGYFETQGAPIDLKRIETHGHLDVPKDIDQRYGAAAWQMFKADPMLLIEKVGIGAIRFWYFSSSPTKSLANGVVNSGVVLFAIIGLFIVPPECRLRAAWLIVFCFAFVFLYALIIIHSSRFSLPIVLAILPLATAPVAALLTSHEKSSRNDVLSSSVTSNAATEGLQS